MSKKKSCRKCGFLFQPKDHYCPLCKTKIQSLFQVLLQFSIFIALLILFSFFIKVDQVIIESFLIYLWVIGLSLFFIVLLSILGEPQVGCFTVVIIMVFTLQFQSQIRVNLGWLQKSAGVFAGAASFLILRFIYSKLQKKKQDALPHIKQTHQIILQRITNLEEKKRKSRHVLEGITKTDDKTIQKVNDYLETLNPLLAQYYAKLWHFQLMIAGNRFLTFSSKWTQLQKKAHKSDFFQYPLSLEKEIQQLEDGKEYMSFVSPFKSEELLAIEDQVEKAIPLLKETLHSLTNMKNDIKPTSQQKKAEGENIFTPLIEIYPFLEGIEKMEHHFDKIDRKWKQGNLNWI
ncbi:MAG: hypothetical protein ACI86H_001903 [bacterium]|jgi:hypothetical protein